MISTANTVLPDPGGPYTIVNNCWLDLSRTAFWDSFKFEMVLCDSFTTFVSANFWRIAGLESGVDKII